MISLDDGRLLVRAAREAVLKFLRDGNTIQDERLAAKFSAKSGVFVTLNDQSGLRGCIGHPLPDMELCIALKDAAIAAATKDPRFSPLRPEELDGVTFEVTILTKPEDIDVDSPAELLGKIKVGRDGLIVRNGFCSGLLLPQVPTEYGWNEREFLEHTCQKAGLPDDCWKEQETRIERFQGTIFKEESPNGDIIKEELWDLKS